MQVQDEDEQEILRRSKQAFREMRLTQEDISLSLSSVLIISLSLSLF